MALKPLRKAKGTPEEAAQLQSRILDSRRKAWADFHVRMGKREEEAKWPPGNRYAPDWGLFVHFPKPYFEGGVLTPKDPPENGACLAYLALGAEDTLIFSVATPHEGTACPSCLKRVRCDHKWEHYEWGAPEKDPALQWGYAECTVCKFEVAYRGRVLPPDGPLGWTD